MSLFICFSFCETYCTLSSRAPSNQKMRDDYNVWRKQAQMALSKYQLGEISWEEFEEIIQNAP